MPATNPNAFAALRLLHRSLLIGMALFTGLTLYLVVSGAFKAQLGFSLDRNLQVVAALLSVGCLFIGFRVFRNKIFEIRKVNASGEEKFNRYRLACIIWWALIEMPGLFGAICFLLSSNYAFFALACFHILALAVFMPRRDNIIVLLNLSSEEANELGN
jgi:hypothetical protein